MRSAWRAAVVAFVLASCSSPTKPTVTVAAGQPVSPAYGAQISYYDQPITLLVTNGIATGGALPTSTVEVATDTAFISIVDTQTISPGTTGQVRVTLDRLQPAMTYHWRVKTNGGDNHTVSSITTFSISPLLVLQPPTPVQPLADSFPHKQPVFTVTNAARSGPPATVTYHFEVATDASFTNVVSRGTVAETASQTSFTSTVDLTPGATYYWRAQASDVAKGVVSAYSARQVFTTVFPEDGNFHYTLAVRSPSLCLTKFTSFGGCSGSPIGWTISDFAYDSTLVVADDTLRFSFRPAAYGNFGGWPAGPLALIIQLAGNRLAGTVTGTTDGSGTTTQGFPIQSVLFEGTVSGDSDNQGRFVGTFDGRMGLWKYGFPCDVMSTCLASGFTWTLSPR